MCGHAPFVTVSTSCQIPKGMKSKKYNIYIFSKFTHVSTQMQFSTLWRLSDEFGDQKRHLAIFLATKFVGHA